MKNIRRSLWLVALLLSSASPGLLAQNTPLLDFGDAPDAPYPTLHNNDGARHAIIQGLTLGSRVDPEQDGQQNVDATGDDAPTAVGPDDEDGVVFLSPPRAGQESEVRVTVAGQGFLNAWIDFNGNGSWADNGDQIFTARPLVSGIHNLIFPVPASAKGGTTFARFRWSRANEVGFAGDGGGGEVEDYAVTIEGGAPQEPKPCAVGCDGTDFWLTFPGNYAPDPANPVVPKLYILGAGGTSVAINAPGLVPPFSTNVTIPASMTLEVTLPPGVDLGNSNDLIEDKGIHVVASAPISVQALSKVQYSSDGYLALPTPALGFEHFVISYRNAHADVPELNGSQFAILATQTNTSIAIVPKALAGARDPGVAYTITLHAGQTYQLRTTTGAPADLTGTRIISDKPIAVFGSHACANISNNTEFFCDYVVEQLPPVNHWVDEFYTRRLATRSGGDVIRVLAAHDNTAVTVDGSVVATLNQGQFYESIRPASSSLDATRITSSSPVLVAQYASSSDFDGTLEADPFMSLVPGRARFSAEHRFVVPPGFTTSHINVIAPSGAAVLLDGVAISGFTPIAGSTFSQSSQAVTPGRHVITSAQPVGVNLYGWNTYESFGWPTCLFFGDVTPPQITCPPPVRVTLGQNANGVVQCEVMLPDMRQQVKVQDDCSPINGLRIQQSPAPGTLLGPGAHVITFSVADEHGNVGTCTTTVTVIPAEPISVQCPSDITVACTSGGPTRVEFNVVARVGCEEVPLVSKPASGSMFPVGVTEVTSTLPNSNPPIMCTFTVTVTCGPKINTTLEQSNLALVWEGAYVLQSAVTPVGPWQDVPNATGRFTVNTRQQTSQFFRLRPEQQR